MPSLLLVAAAYAAYKHTHNEDQQNEDQEPEASIDLDNKTSVLLLSAESEFGIYEAPISTITFFDGSYREAATALMPRIVEVLQENPWLGGWILKDKNDKDLIKIFFDPTGKDHTPDHFQMLPPGQIPLSRERTKYDEISEVLSEHGVLVENTKSIIGRNKPIFKLSIIPDADQPDQRFALVMSFSHLGGDACTYYNIFRMLDAEAPVQALSPIRDHRFPNVLEQNLGEQEINYVKNQLSLERNIFDWGKKKDDPIERRVFYVSKDFIREGKEGSDTMLSANSIITSWFLKSVQASVGFMVCNLRNRLEGCDVTDHDAGNYTHGICYMPVDYDTPDHVQKSLAYFRRCGMDPPTELPRFKRNFKLSVSVNWSTFLHDGIHVCDGVDLKLHLPLFTKAMIQSLPSNFSMLQLFTIEPKENEDRKVGANVVAPRSVWSVIDESGIVEKYLPSSFQKEGDSIAESGSAGGEHIHDDI